MKFNFDTIVFDFDGVLVESVDIKTQAFKTLYKNYNEKLIKEIVAYHLNNGGVTRYEKIRYVHKNILGKNLSVKEEIQLITKFSELVEDLVITAKWVPGTFEFLNKYQKLLPLHILSATPEDELLRIIKGRQMSQYFSSITGAPGLKSETLLKICKFSNYAPKKILMIGDSYSDFEAAQIAQTSFIGLVPHGSISPFPKNTLLIEDLNFLPNLILKN